MTLTQLAYAVALAEHGHFGRAAEACFVTQPTLSMQLQKLEQELGVLLFDRSLQPVRLTERGQQVITQARIILAERDRLLDLLRDTGPVAGELRIGVIPTLATYLLPLLAPALKARYPALELAVEEITTTHLLDRLSEGRLDAGLVATEEARPGLESLLLFREPFVGYIGVNHALAGASELRVEDLATADLWLLTEGHCLRDQVVQLCQRAHHPPDQGTRFECGHLETLRLLVDRVGGMTLLPMLATHYLDEDERDALRYFAAPAPDRGVRLIRARASTKQRHLDALGEVVKEVVAAVL